MDFYDAVRTRQSIRKYKADPIPEDVLDRLFEAFQFSPSWANAQPWELIVITDAALKEKLQTTVPPSNPSYRAMVDAPVLISIIGILGRSGWYKGKTVTNRGDWVLFDTGIATEHLVLAAAAEGLGTVHIGLFDFESAGQILNLPEDRTVVEFIPLGYPESIPPRVKRKSISEFVFREKYGTL
jgi:nitroreductase